MKYLRHPVQYLVLHELQGGSKILSSFFGPPCTILESFVQFDKNVCSR
jgi:hypothetical protein